MELEHFLLHIGLNHRSQGSVLMSGCLPHLEVDIRHGTEPLCLRFTPGVSGEVRGPEPLCLGFTCDGVTT